MRNFKLKIFDALWGFVFLCTYVNAPPTIVQFITCRICCDRWFFVLLPNHLLKRYGIHNFRIFVPLGKNLRIWKDLIVLIFAIDDWIVLCRYVMYKISWFCIKIVFSENYVRDECIRVIENVPNMCFVVLVHECIRIHRMRWCVWFVGKK